MFSKCRPPLRCFSERSGILERFAGFYGLSPSDDLRIFRQQAPALSVDLLGTVRLDPEEQLKEMMKMIVLITDFPTTLHAAADPSRVIICMYFDRFSIWW